MLPAIDIGKIQGATVGAFDPKSQRFSVFVSMGNTDRFQSDLRGEFYRLLGNDFFSKSVAVSQKIFPRGSTFYPVVQLGSCVKGQGVCVEAFRAEVDQAGDVSHVAVGEEDPTHRFHIRGRITR